MADNSEGDLLSSELSKEEVLVQRHKKERKELQG